MATRDENTDASRTGPGPSRESKTTPIPDYFQHPEPVPNGNQQGNKKDRPAG